MDGTAGDSMDAATIRRTTVGGRQSSTLRSRAGRSWRRPSSPTVSPLCRAQ